MKPNTTYCVTFHVVNTNNNPYAIGSFGAYFGNSGMDTITQCNVPLVYLTPQIEHPNSNIITDTLNWVPITGTFVADGSEKYMVIGNFKSEAATNTLLINPTYSTAITADICIDDVSCIELDLPAYAGRDTTLMAGNSLFLGREPDVGIDEACVWYKLPGATPIDTGAGFWIAPAVTSTYVVVQTICGLIKSDTVVVNLTTTGIKAQSLLDKALKLYPVPAGEAVSLTLSSAHENEKFNLELFNYLGQQVLKEELVFKSGAAILNTSDLPNGAYLITISNANHETVTKTLLIAK